MSRKLTYDSWLFATVTILVVAGLVMIFSASAIIATQRFDKPAHYFLVRQILFLIAGGAAALVLMKIDPAILRDRRVAYGGLALVAVALFIALFQAPVNATHRWIVFPGFQLQPSEFAKPAMILFLAAFLSRREERINDLTATILPLGFVLTIVAGLILLGRDLGTALTVLAIAGGIIFAAGISRAVVSTFAICGAAAFAYFAMSAAYRRERLLSFLNPEDDPLGSGFQAMQSLIAIGTGGFTGLGIGNGRQKLFFLPEPHTDFIFSIVGEELGFVGAFLLLVAFGVLVWRGMRVAWRSRDRFAFHIAVGCTLMIAVQVLINVSVALCLFPTKGLPLPLISHGGSSLLASLMAMGLLLNFSQHSS